VDAAEKKPNQPLIVLGVERSGTSLVAEMVYRWGAYGGGFEDLTRVDECNPQGYWEYKPVARFHAELFNAVEFSPWNPSFKQRIKEMAYEPQYRRKALELIAGMQRENGAWFWKDPKLIFFLPFWQEIWDDPVYLITVRNPYDTALSWQKFILPAELHGQVRIIAANLLHWQYMMFLVLEHTSATRKKMFVSYEELIRDPLKGAAQISDFLNLECGVEQPDDRKIDAMAQTVNPKLWRFRNEVPFSQVSEATDDQKAQYEFIRKIIRNPSEPFDPGKYRMYPGWQEYMMNLRGFLNYYAQTRKAR
jgi:hypothetical protein